MDEEQQAQLQEKLQEKLIEMQAHQGEGLTGMLGLTWSGVISGVLFGIIGMWMLNRARKKSNLKLVAVSFALMFYPYVTRGPVQDWGVGIALCGLAYYLWDR